MKNGAAIFSVMNFLFSFSGISFRLGNKILEASKSKIDKDDAKSVIYFEVSALFYNCLVGDWGSITKYSDKLVFQNLAIGEVFFAAIYTIGHIWVSTMQGCFKDTECLIDNYFKMASVYENDFSKVDSIRFNIFFLMKYRKIHQALNEVNNGKVMSRKMGQETYIYWIYIWETHLKIILKDINGAEISLRYAESFFPEDNKKIPLFYGYLPLTKFIFHLNLLHGSIETGSKTGTIKKATLKVGKETVRVCRKMALIRTEALKLMGSYYWLISKQKKALKWWNKSIEAGECIGDRIELSRTYMEVGKRLLEPKSKYKNLNGIKAEEYLSKAKTMFKEMDLQWDLDELEKLY
jgi:hypothetical protein